MAFGALCLIYVSLGPGPEPSFFNHSRDLSIINNELKKYDLRNFAGVNFSSYITIKINLCGYYVAI